MKMRSENKGIRKKGKKEIMKDILNKKSLYEVYSFFFCSL